VLLIHVSAIPEPSQCLTSHYFSGLSTCHIVLGISFFAGLLLLTRLIHVAYRKYGYRLVEIAEHLGVRTVTVSRLLTQAE